MKPRTPSPWMTGAEVMDYLRKGRTWLKANRHLFQTVQIAGRGRTGKEYRYFRESVEDWMRGHQQTGRTLEQLVEAANRKAMRESANR